MYIIDPDKPINERTLSDFLIEDEARGDHRLRQVWH